jgi:predicted enzyme related to lactoylglutathione lyase
MHTHHGIDYVELTVPDVAEAKRFYGQAFGWRFTDYGPDYAGIQGEGREVGGFAKGTPTVGLGPLVILYSADLDASVAAVKAALGRIVKPTFEFPGGRRFHFADPGGNELAVWGA